MRFGDEFRPVLAMVRDPIDEFPGRADKFTATFAKLAAPAAKFLDRIAKLGGALAKFGELSGDGSPFGGKFRPFRGIASLSRGIPWPPVAKLGRSGALRVVLPKVLRLSCAELRRPRRLRESGPGLLAGLVARDGGSPGRPRTMRFGATENSDHTGDQPCRGQLSSLTTPAINLAEVSSQP
ncbi:MAG: hypothetical protein ACOX6T_10670 [Myxococcales bacterium]